MITEAMYTSYQLKKTPAARYLSWKPKVKTTKSLCWLQKVLPISSTLSLNKGHTNFYSLSRKKPANIQSENSVHYPFSNKNRFKHRTLSDKMTT